MPLNDGPTTSAAFRPGEALYQGTTGEPTLWAGRVPTRVHSRLVIPSVVGPAIAGDCTPNRSRDAQLLLTSANGARKSGAPCPDSGTWETTNFNSPTCARRTPTRYHARKRG